jgi:hypothetical protein
VPGPEASRYKKQESRAMAGPHCCKSRKAAVGADWCKSPLYEAEGLKLES